jgi:hypothetical protein
VRIPPQIPQRRIALYYSYLEPRCCVCHDSSEEVAFGLERNGIEEDCCEGCRTSLVSLLFVHHNGRILPSSGIGHNVEVCHCTVAELSN